MRCLNCHEIGLAVDTNICPACGVLLSSLTRDLLRQGHELRGYKIEYPLGRGGFGVTYRGIHTNLDHVVAIKEFYPQEFAIRRDSRVMCKPSDVGTFRSKLQRFMNEGRTLVRVRHPNIVEAKDLFEENGTAYLVMEFVEGNSLRQIMDRRGKPFDVSFIERVVEQLVGGLTVLHCHAEPIYHLDIKPENIIVAGERVVLIDFGSARLAGQEESSVPVTPEYAPWELFKKEWGPESDIYELGTVVYEMLVGHRPPSAIERLGKRRDWRPGKETTSWQKMLDCALSMDRGCRPHDIQAWWEMRNRRTESIVAPISGMENVDRRSPRNDDGTVEDLVDVIPTMIVAQDGESDFESIQDAIDKAEEDDIILLHCGHYSGPVILSGLKGVRLLGEKGVWVEGAGNGSGPALSITDCHDVRVQGIIVRHGVTVESPSPTISICNSHNIEVVNCEASGSALGAGIEITDRSKVTIQQSRFSHNRIGMYIHAGSSVEVNYCLCEENRQYGVWAQGRHTSVTLNDNHCNRNGEVGIVYSDDAKGALARNACDTNGYHGIAIVKNSKIEPFLRDNICRNHPGAGISWSWEAH